MGFTKKGNWMGCLSYMRVVTGRGCAGAVLAPAWAVVGGVIQSRRSALALGVLSLILCG